MAIELLRIGKAKNSMEKLKFTTAMGLYLSILDCYIEDFIKMVSKSEALSNYQTAINIQELALGISLQEKDSLHFPLAKR